MIETWSRHLIFSAFAANSGASSRPLESSEHAQTGLPSDSCGQERDAVISAGKADNASDLGLGRLKLRAVMVRDVSEEYLLLSTCSTVVITYRLIYIEQAILKMSL